MITVALGRAAAWLERIDPGTHRRIKGLRLVTAYGIAAMLGTLWGISNDAPSAVSLGPLAGGFALWASVSEARTTRRESSRDLILLNAAAALGALSVIALAPVLSLGHWPGPELTLVSGAFLVSYLKRFGILGAGLGSQIYIGQLLAYGAGLRGADWRMILAAAVIAAVSAVVPRVLSGPAEHPALAPPEPITQPRAAEFRMGLQAAIAALFIVLLNEAIGLAESAWAITACTYVIAGSTAGTMQRVGRRIVGTVIGVPLGLACLPVTAEVPVLIWLAAAFAMVIYAMALPERYDVACGAWAFTLIVTMAVTGEGSPFILAARAWETLIGGALGLAAALLILPLRISGADNK